MGRGGGESGTFSQYQPAPTAPLSCPMVTLLRGLISSQISTLKMSMMPRSNAPPSRKTLPLFFPPLDPCITMWILESVPAPLMSPVITWTLYTMPVETLGDVGQQSQHLCSFLYSQFFALFVTITIKYVGLCVTTSDKDKSIRIRTWFIAK